MADGELIGVVTVTYNSASVLPDFLRCLFDQTHTAFILFAVDNASKDDTLQLLNQCGEKRIRIITNPDNRGVAEGNNQGIRAALESGCGSVLLINNDTEFDATLIAQLVKGLDAHKVEMICPKMMYFDEPDHIWAAGGNFQPWFGYRAIHFGDRELDHGQYNRARLVTYVPTCCVLIRKEVFDKVGLMDERYFVYVDDVDFMYRAMKAGVRLLYLPTAKLLHKVGGLTGGEDSPFAVRYGTRNRTFFLLKHFGFIRTLPWLVICYVSWMYRAANRPQKDSWLALKRSALREGLQMRLASKQAKSQH